MGIIAISRMYGASGTTLAKKLAQCLNYQYVDKDYINNSIKKEGFPFLADITEDEETPSFAERIEELFTNKSFYKTALMATVYRLALKDNIVFAGRAANLILEGVENVVSIQVVAKISDRVKHISEIMNMSYEDALELIKKKDDEKKEFLNYYFDKEFCDPSAFFMIINLSYMGINDAIDLICSYAKKHFEKTDMLTAQEKLKDRLTEKNADLLMFKHDLLKEGKIEFEAKNGGKILIAKGIVAGEESKQKIIKSLRKIKGVEQIEDNLKIGILSHIIF